MSVPATQSVIEGFWLKNFRGIRQIALGSSFIQNVVADFGQDLSPYELTPLTTLIGASGSGKRSILDAFAFLADIMVIGLDEALSKRGGFDAVYNRGSEGPISIGIVYRACAAPVPVTYAVNIDRCNNSDSGEIESEGIIYRGDSAGRKIQTVLFFQNGKKDTRYLSPWKSASINDIEKIKRTNSKNLGLAKLGEYEDIPDIPQLKRCLESFHRSCFTPDNALGLSPPNFKPDKNLRLFTEFSRFVQKHPAELPGMLDIISQRMPGVSKISLEQSKKGHLLLRFILPDNTEPFEACQVSEGTLRLFSHLLLLENPVPTPLIGIEEPAAYLDLSQIQSFCSFIREHTLNMGGTQFFITTNSAMLADFMDPTEVWILSKKGDGETEAVRAYDELNFRGVNLNTIGPYWYTDYIYRGQETKYPVGA